MRLINVKVFLGREELIRDGRRLDRRTKVLEFRDDEVTAYAILSHRWINQEVNYDEMVELAKMDAEERDEIRQRDGYRKILDSCERAKKDGYEWLWVDTCCIDKRSSAELSEAINSMYQWYENARVCYVYLHDVPGSSFPTGADNEGYPDSNGFPEWFSRGWTLQEMIAPSNVQFFNKGWQPLGDKRTLAYTLSHITQVPQYILTDGLSSNRPCVAQIMSWAANRTTTRVEDRAYSLLGLLDVNMPMLYGEGKKAFQRLQLEIIRMSDDQTIFAWGLDRETRRTGSILADDPSFFRGCSKMELMDPDDFIQYLKKSIPAEELPTMEEDQFGTFPITNRGIQIWMLLCPYVGSDSVFEAWLPCRFHPWSRPVRIPLALWKSNYYRYFTTGEGSSTGKTLQFRQLYLRYQDTPHRATFEVDDSAITKNGFAYSCTYPPELTGNTITLTSTDPLCIKVYSDTQANCLLSVGFGQCFGQNWIHFIYGRPSWGMWTTFEYDQMLVGGPEYARSMPEMRFRGGCYGRVWVKHTRLPRSTWTVQTSCVMWESSRSCGIKIDVFRNPYNGSDEWVGFDVEGTNDPNCDMRGLTMIRDGPRKLLQSSYTLLLDGISAAEFSLAPKGIKLGDYGYFTASEVFCCEGNIFADLRSRAFTLDITPNQHKIVEKDGYNTDSDYVEAYESKPFVIGSLTLYKPLGLSLPRNHDFYSLLVSLSGQLTNRYLVTRVIECATMLSGKSSRQWSHHASSHRSSTLVPTTVLCTIAKPFIWYQNEGAGPASMNRSGNRSGVELMDVDEG
ncbi:heterokaryon incompatibility protein-domain-containing protein [Scleroderma yunnanense]